ncbi:hypothetical protein ALC62_09824 [Cyphomyrmex costatus]|uniref:Uncharacterized protein n=1 Tax=Cyphomyrmex costatus TaxID=456900 RepID=A0A195CFC6_9HYME|nr:hypothetical protein ALC62_09824 [Cyphomyrmex costatus]
MNGARMWLVVETFNNNGERLGEALWSHFSCRHALHTGAQPTLISRCAIEKIIESESRPPQPEKRRWAINCYTGIRSVRFLGLARLSGASAFGHERRSKNLIMFRMEFVPSIGEPPLNTAYLGMLVTPSRSAESHANAWRIANHNDGTARAEGAFEETVILYPARRRHAHLCLLVTAACSRESLILITWMSSKEARPTRLITYPPSATGRGENLLLVNDISHTHEKPISFWVMCVSTRNGDYRDGSPFQRIIWYFLILSSYRSSRLMTRNR